MSKSNRAAWMVAIWACACLASCQVNKDMRAPKGFLPTGPAKVAREAYGGWMVAILNPSRNAALVQGELITIQNDTLYVLSQPSLTAIPVSDVENARLELHLQNASGFALWALAGGFSTLSHGAFLIFSLPAWAIFGTSVSSSAARQPNIIHYPGIGFEEFKKFSRFPQGLPPGVDPYKLEGKPVIR